MGDSFIPNIFLSKSRFLAGFQCPRRLWYQNYKPDLASAVTPAQQALFDTGYEVGKLATQRFPGGVRVEEDHLHHAEAVQKTGLILKDRKIPAIYEAGFLFDDIRVRADILERGNGGAWNLVEVKSSTMVKDYHQWDVALQSYVLKGSGIKIDRAGVMHINNQYVFKGGSHDLNSLFLLTDLTPTALMLSQEIPAQVKAFKEILSRESPPDVEPSRHCWKPYSCDFWNYCTLGKPEYWVFKLHGILQSRLAELFSMGIQDIPSIPEYFPLSPLQRRIKSCVVTQREYLDPELLRELKKAIFPLHFLDFETLGPAIPLYPQTRPYQTIPFQWSNHRLSRNGSLTHREYLCPEPGDPREELGTTLLEALGEKGTILIYTNYEVGVIRDLAEHLPKYRDRLLATLDRMMDLHGLIQRNYYHPKFYGSFSLKSVLPALIPEMAYNNLAIQDGNEASCLYLKMINPGSTLGERDQIKKDLLTYCRHDTLALVKIREELLKKSG